jgi:hypothetical protein
VYATNAIEGSTLTLGETIAVLEQGITVVGKSVADHLDAINGQSAYQVMLDLAQARADVSLEMILELHRAVVGGSNPIAGNVRDGPVYIRLVARAPEPHKDSEFDGRDGRSIRGGGAWWRTPGFDCGHLHFALLTIHRSKIFCSCVTDTHRSYWDRSRKRCISTFCKKRRGVPGIGNPDPFVASMAELEKAALERYFAALERAHG